MEPSARENSDLADQEKNRQYRVSGAGSEERKSFRASTVSV